MKRTYDLDQAQKLIPLLDTAYAGSAAGFAVSDWPAGERHLVQHIASQFGAHQDKADLWSVAVRQHHLVAHAQQFDHLLETFLEIAVVLLDGSFLTRARDGIAPQGHDRATSM